jgi:hypothetical protein
MERIHFRWGGDDTRRRLRSHALAMLPKQRARASDCDLVIGMSAVPDRWVRRESA